MHAVSWSTTTDTLKQTTKFEKRSEADPQSSTAKKAKLLTSKISTKLRRLTLDEEKEDEEDGEDEEDEEDEEDKEDKEISDDKDDIQEIEENMDED